MIVYQCDLCGEVKACRQRRIEDREYDICEACWMPIAARLPGKGRKVKEAVYLPAVETGTRRAGEPRSLFPVGRRSSTDRSRADQTTCRSPSGRPRAKRSNANGVRSNPGFRPATRSATRRPAAGECWNPWPLKPATT